MFQRLDKLRKNAFASVILFGTNNSSSISGVWVFRGQELAFPVRRAGAGAGAERLAGGGTHTLLLADRRGGASRSGDGGAGLAPAALGPDDMCLSWEWRV